MVRVVSHPKSQTENNSSGSDDFEVSKLGLDEESRKVSNGDNWQARDQEV